MSSTTERLRAEVSAASGERARLAALLALARHYADASDGANGLEAARKARQLAMRLADTRAVAQALNAASVSQYHRSDYVSALATAMDAWDAACQARCEPATAESHFAIGLSLLALGETASALRVADKGLALTSAVPELEVEHVHLVGLKAMACFNLGEVDEAEEHLGHAVALSRGAAASQLAVNQGNWGIALLRVAERMVERGEDPGDRPARSREHFDIALSLARTEGDVLRVADRLSYLGQLAMLEGDLAGAERLLVDAIGRSRALDYVRTLVLSARYLARLYLIRGDAARAIELLRMAESAARRGAPGDSLPALKLLLAEALEMRGAENEAAALRLAASELQQLNAVHRSRAAEEARKLAARVLGA